MRTIAILLVVALFAAAQVAALTPEQQQKLKAIHTECLTATGVDEEIAKKAKNGEYVDDPKLKEYTLCLAKKMGFINDAGEIQSDAIKTALRKNLNEEEVTKAMNKCVTAKATPQETAFELFKCWRSKAQKKAGNR